jgi:HEAT repeat protein
VRHASLALAVALWLGVARPAAALDWSGKLAEVERGLRSPLVVEREAAVEALRALDRDAALPLLRLALADSEAAIVERAMAVVGDRGLTEATPLVAALAADPRAAVRAAACELIARLAPPEAGRAALRRALGDTAASVRRAAAAALVHLDRAGAVAEVSALLDDPADEVRVEVVRLLGELRDPALLHPLLERARDTSASVRARAVETLGRLGDRRAVPAILAALGDLDPDVVLAAVAALGRLRDPVAVAPLASLISGAFDDRLKRRAARALGEIGAPAAIPALLYALHLPEARKTAAAALAAIGAPAVPALLAELAARADAGGYRAGDLVRRDVIEALGRIGDRRATAALLAELAAAAERRDEAPGALGGDGRVEVLAALALLADPASLLPVLALLDDPVLEVKLAAMEALRPIADARAVDPLVKAAFDVDTRVARAAVTLLGTLRAARAVPALIELAESGRGDLSARAATALGLAGDARAVGPLLTLLGHADAALRREAADALANLGDTAAVAPMVAHLRAPGVAGKPEATRALGVLLRGKPPDPRVVDLLSGFLGSGDPSLVASAVQALGAMRAEAAAGALIARWPAARTPVRLAIVEALGEIGAPAARALLREALAAPDARVRAAAAWAMGRAGDHDAAAAAALRPLLRDADPAVRTNAFWAAAVAGGREAAGALVDAAAAEPDRWARANACLALGLLATAADAPAPPDEALVEGALRCVADADADVRRSGVRALAELQRLLEGGPAGPAAGAGAAKLRVANALAATASGDEREEVRALAARALAGEIPAWRSVARTSWLAYRPVGPDGGPLCGARFLVLFPTGEVRATTVDLHGEVRESGFADGEVYFDPGADGPTAPEAERAAP